MLRVTARRVMEVWKRRRRVEEEEGEEEDVPQAASTLEGQAVATSDSYVLFLCVVAI
jgi:hypothetical protein